MRKSTSSPARASRPHPADSGFGAPLARPAEVSPARAARAFAACRGPLLAWFAANARELPWRAPLVSPARPGRGKAAPLRGFPDAPRALRSPYGVWVSEIMLQQTVVAAVIGHYRRWMKEFPTVLDLAAAAPERVLRAWAGLGYYARVRNLHKGAQVVAQRGDWPLTAAEWREVPGVGEYTAGAVSSLAFDRREPILDGNVVRVFSRLLGLGFLPGAGAEAKRTYWDLARLWVSDEVVEGAVEAADAVPGTAGRLNEALMELGALVCAPASPRCGMCPMAAVCAARLNGWTAQLPPPKPRPAPRVVRATALVASGPDGVLLEKRGAGGFLAGHDLFPFFPEPEGAAPKARNADGDMASRVRALGFSGFKPPVRAADVRHTIMATRYDIEVWTVALAAGVPRHPKASEAPPGMPPGPSLRWVPVSEVEEVLTNALARKIWRTARGA